MHKFLILNNKGYFLNSEILKNKSILFFRHIQEELEDIYTEEDIRNMDHDELAFTFFS